MNPNKNIWFKQKTYGWGWTPANWQGWLSVIIFVLLTTILPIRFATSENHFHLIIFLISTFVLTVIFIILCYIKGEKPQWRWGNKDN